MLETRTRRIPGRTLREGRDGLRQGKEDVAPRADPHFVGETGEAGPLLAGPKELRGRQVPPVERDLEVSEQDRTEATGLYAGRLREAVARDLVVEADEDLPEVDEERPRHGLMAWAGIRYGSPVRLSVTVA